MNLIFDFDGTICDSSIPIVDIYNKILSRMGYQKISYKEVGKIGYKGYIKKHKLSPRKVSKIISAYWEEDAEIIYKDAKPFKNIRSVLKRLSSKHKLGILTSNKVEIVQSFLDKHKLNYFDFVYSEEDVFGKDKRLKKIMRKYNLEIDNTLYIGDETRDIEAAKKLKLKTIAVTWGIESKQLLEKSNPDYIISKPEKLLKIQY